MKTILIEFEDDASAEIVYERVEELLVELLKDPASGVTDGTLSMTSLTVTLS